MPVWPTVRLSRVRRSAAGARGATWRAASRPGQYLTDDFPVLSAGPTPRTPLDHWSFTIDGLVASPLRWTWDEFMALPSRELVVDISCVTKWTKLDMRWHGVSVDTLLERVELEPGRAFVIAYSDGGYTTNLPLADVLNGQAFVAYEYDGAPLAPEHGGPARLVVPHLYFWKSAKWVRGLRVLVDGRARLLGVARLPQPRRPVARRALQRRLSGHRARPMRRAARAGRSRPSRAIRDETPTVKTFTLALPELARPSGRPARRHPADRRGRLPGAAQLLDRLGAGAAGEST